MQLKWTNNCWALTGIVLTLLGYMELFDKEVFAGGFALFSAGACYGEYLSGLNWTTAKVEPE